MQIRNLQAAGEGGNLVVVVREVRRRVSGNDYKVGSRTAVGPEYEFQFAASVWLVRSPRHTGQRDDAQDGVPFDTTPFRSSD